MVNYDYPHVEGSTGSRWTMIQRIKEEVGVNPRMSCSTQIDGQMRTVVSFDNELDTTQKAALDALMASNPNHAPTPAGSVFIIMDLYVGFVQFCADIGLPARIYFTDSTTGLTNSDQIEIHFEKTLSQQEKNKVFSQYGNLIRQQL